MFLFEVTFKTLIFDLNSYLFALQLFSEKKEEKSFLKLSLGKIFLRIIRKDVLGTLNPSFMFVYVVDVYEQTLA